MSAQEFFKEWSKMTVALKESEKGRLIDAISDYAISGNIRALNGREECLMSVFCNLINEKQKEGLV